MVSGSIAVGNLPDELVSDILSRLSVKSLMKFRIVCKSWDALTRDPIFITDHMKYSSASSQTEDNTTTILRYYSKGYLNVTMFCHATFRETFAFKIPLLGNKIESSKMLGPCNGIMCFYLKKNSPRVGTEELSLWNPATQEIKVLPMSNVCPRLPNDFILCNSFILFGHDPQTNDYKVVKILRGFLVSDGNYTYEHDEPSYYKEFGMHVHKSRNCSFTTGHDKRYTNCIVERVEVYSLNKNSWKLVETEKRVTVEYTRFDYVYLNGFCYWVKDYREQNHVVMSFDMTKEVFSEIAIILPEGNYKRILVRDGDIFILNGSLCIGTRHVGDVLKIWAMVEEKEGNGSTNKRWIKRSEVASSMYYDVMLTLKNGDMIVQCFHNDCEERLRVYDSTNHIFKPLDILTSLKTAQILFCPETLVSLKTT